MMNIELIILAAGKGTRMNSKLPKVLHKIAGKPMLSHVLETALLLNPTKTQVVVGYGADLIKQQISEPVDWVLQTEQLGTGHAVAQAKSAIDDENISLILYGDVPLISDGVLRKLCQSAKKTGFALLSATLENPFGYGRIIRENKQVQRIVEHKDATIDELGIGEINTGIMAVSGQLLKKYLEKLDNNNAQNEYYLTDIVAMAVADNILVEGVIADNFQETQGVNNRSQQANAERYLQQKLANKLMDMGATIIDPNRVDIRGEVSVGKDVEIDINVIFVGKVFLGDHVKIGANTVIKNCTVARNSVILENCVLENSEIGINCVIGPFARIRPDTKLLADNKVGNFVEIKKSTIKKGSKINHLSYIGDTKIGENCNIGAGVITCNYDGVSKHQTLIGDDVFVGSDTQLIAPIKIADQITIGAGSTLNKDVLDKNCLVLSRRKIKIIEDWRRSKKC